MVPLSGVTMWTEMRLLCAAAAVLSLSLSAVATALEVRQDAHGSASPISSSIVARFTQVTATVTAAYSGPSLAAITVTLTSTAPTSGNMDGGETNTPSQFTQPSQVDYLEAVCAPQNNTVRDGFDLRFPCNVYLNISYTCMYNQTAEESNTGSSVIQQNAQAQQQCLCPGGPGAAFWENAEG